MESGALGKVFDDGEVIIQQGERGDRMFVVQDGYVEVVKEFNGVSSQIAILGKGDFFGEMAIFEREVRMATVRAMGTARILTIDQKNFLRRIHEDPSLAYRIVQVMSHRIRELDEKITQLRMDSTQEKQPTKPHISKEDANLVKRWLKIQSTFE